jgi:hypothetical protein
MLPTQVALSCLHLARCPAGSLVVNDVELNEHDAARIVAGAGGSGLGIQAGPEGVHFLMVEMAQQP